MKELTGEYEKKRKRLVKDIKTAVKVYKFRHQVCTGAISIRQQREMLDLTRKRLELERGQPTVHVDEGLNSQMALEMTSNENSPLLVGRDHLDQCKDQ
jgi:TATA-box binding protein (TBP) (component of TFIID and TFIIIB)